MTDFILVISTQLCGRHLGMRITRSWILIIITWFKRIQYSVLIQLVFFVISVKKYFLYDWIHLEAARILYADIIMTGYHRALSLPYVLLMMVIPSYFLQKCGVVTMALTPKSPLQLSTLFCLINCTYY